ncbi:hypothetical protein OSSY52_18810 [Tepiditoga spiralis]|uniref:TOTE conflict system primase domain-containing protein n=1 Tax=Tepiditoga spiralis TaxID=2108365 RepID=A0A7G1G594_9BACT|nr:CRISPR-associated primase-polymerase type A1 [Tepiditoga spiralis]BBE31740.1 hypothetical protein OSSY52_18810 [Tepiditoga spiralis]
MGWLKKAVKYEEEFKFKEALNIYKKKEKKLKIEDGSLIRYGTLLYEFQMYNDAKRIYEKIIKLAPNKLEHKEMLAKIYENLNKTTKAVELYKELNIKDKVQTLIDKENFNNPNLKIIKKFIELFNGREDVISFQYENGYRPIRRPLNTKDVYNHFKGKRTLGIYQLKKDNTIKFAAYDIDIKKAYHKTSEENKNNEKLKDITHQLIDKLNNLNFNTYVEWSGNKGYHIWIFFETPVQSYKVKCVMEYLLNQIQTQEEIGVEIFPKQSNIGEGLGNLIKVPLGLHQKTKNKCLFVNKDTLTPIKNQIKYLMNIEYTNYDIIKELYNECSSDFVYKTIVKSKTKKANKNTIKNVIRKEINNNTQNDDIKKIITNCTIIKQIIKKIENEAYITEEEEKIFVESLIKIKDSKNFIEEMLKKTINFSAIRLDLLMKKEKNIPITCEEIKKTILNKELHLNLEKCNCKFLTTYNSPYSIIYDIDKLFLEKVEINDIVKKIMEKNSQKYEIEKEIKSLKKMILKIMGEKTEINFDLGIIKKDGNDVNIII